PSGPLEDWPEISKFPPVPAYELLAEEKCQQAHAAEEDAERHLVTPQGNERRSPGILSGGSGRFVEFALSTLGPFHPDGEHSPQTIRRAGKRSRHHGENREP